MIEGKRDRERIKGFARDTLGCRCPEEVFETIDCRSGLDLGGAVLRDRVNIGNRLLIYVFEAEGPGIIGRNLPGILRAGKEDRDIGGFNRFRLVVATGHDMDGGEEARREADAAFLSTGGMDDRVHLHVISIKDLF